MLQIASISFGLSQIALLLLLLAQTGKKRPTEWILALLLLCVASDLLLQLSRSLTPSYIEWLLSFCRTAIPGMFWLLCYALFDDHFRLKIWQAALVVMLSLLPLCASILTTVSPSLMPGARQLLLIELPQIIELVLVGHGLSIIIRFWNSDLIPLRRSIGQSLVLCSGLFICLVISTRYVFNIYTPWMIDAQYILLGLFLLYFNAKLLKWQQLALFGALIPTIQEHENEHSSPPANAAESQQYADTDTGTDTDTENVNDEEAKVLIEQLKQLMEEEKIYKKIGLTINELAKLMLMPEYRLRLLINGELGYRNFNDFIGRYRIEEAAKRLSDPTEKQLPVLSIALDVGYRSLSSFNKSFKETHDLTPTEYRKKQLMDTH